MGEPITFGRAYYLWKGLLPLEDPITFGRAYYLWESLLPLEEPITFGRAYYLWKGLLPLKEPITFHVGYRRSCVLKTGKAVSSETSARLKLPQPRQKSSQIYHSFIVTYLVSFKPFQQPIFSKYEIL